MHTACLTGQYLYGYALGMASVSVITSVENSSRYYIHTPDGVLLHSVDMGSGQERFYHFDEMGNTTLVTDGDGEVVAAYRYTPYGQPLLDTSDSTFDNPFTWRGQWGVMAEPESHLHYMRARYYDARHARFLSRDPIEGFSPLRINPYVYANLNPLQYIDPMGTEPEIPSLMPSDLLHNPLLLPTFIKRLSTSSTPDAASTTPESNGPVANTRPASEVIVTGQQEVPSVSRRRGNRNVWEDESGIWHVSDAFWETQVRQTREKFRGLVYDAVGFDSSFFSMTGT